MDVSEKCEICGGEDLINDNGFFFCSECGTQSQQAREQYVVKEEIDFTQVAIPTPIIIKEEKIDDEIEEKVTIIEKFQKILQIQCKALVRLGCDPSVKEAVKLVWFRFLKYSGYAFKNSIERPIQLMHQGLSEKQLKYKKNRRVCSNETAKQVKDRITKGRAPKRKQSPTPTVTNKECTCKACVRFGKLKAGTSRDLDDENFVCEFESMPSKQRRKNTISKRKQRSKASPRKRRNKDVTEMSGNAQKGNTGVGIKAKTPYNKREISPKNRGARRKIDFDAEPSHYDQEKLLHLTETSTVKTAEAKVGSDGDLFDFERKAGKRSSTNVKEEPSSPLSGFLDDAHLFEESSASDEENPASVEELDSKDNSKEEADEYYKTLKKQGESHMRVLSLKHTVAICYLGLLYTEQNVLLSDFARWIQLNQFPYHNVLGLLPSSYFQSKDATAFCSKAGDMSADQLYILVRNLCWYLPLPPIPTINPTTMCRIFTERLHLPEYFNKMVGRALSCIESPEFDAAFIHTHRTFEIRCMSLIVYLLKMAYRLDDIYEFEMVEWVRQEEDPADDGDYLYLWEDWLALYCKKRLVSLSNGIPANKSELALVRNPSNFIKYCHDELLTSARSNPTDKNPDTLKPMDPEFGSELSDILKRARLKTKKGAELPPGCDNMPQCIIPIRRVYISDLVKSENVSWKLFDWLQRGPKSSRFHDIEFSHSFKFLLQACSDILDVSATELYEQVCCIESQIVTVTDMLKEVNRIIQDFSAVPGSDRPHQQTQTEEALFPLPRKVQNVSQNKKPISRIPFRRWMLVPDNDDPEVRIPLGRWKFDKKTQTDDIQYSNISESQTSSHELSFICHGSQFQEVMNMSLSEFEMNDLFDFSSDAQSQDSDSVDIQAPEVVTKGSPQHSICSKSQHSRIEILDPSFETEGAVQYAESQVQASNVALSETKKCVPIESPSQISNTHNCEASVTLDSDCHEIGSGALHVHEPQSPIVVPPSPGVRHTFPQLQEALLGMFEYQLTQTTTPCQDILVPQVEAVPIQCKESIPPTGTQHQKVLASHAETKTQCHEIATQQAKTQFLLAPLNFCNEIVDSQPPSLSQIEPECPELTDSQYQTLFMDVTKPHSQESTSTFFQSSHPPSPELSALQMDELSIPCTNQKPLLQDENFENSDNACCTHENQSEKDVEAVTFLD